MCYCPYLCIVCKDIKDNGWGDMKVNLKKINDLSNYSCCGEIVTPSLCDHCYRVYRYKNEKTNGVCLKMYSKKNVNGVWTKLNYTKIK